jgi:chromate transporter
MHAMGQTAARARGTRAGERPLLQLAALYLKLGTIAFGGPAAHIAMMEDEVVRRRGWLTREQFLDLVGVASLIPGPSSTEVAIYIGYSRAGLPGLAVAGASFILPAMLLTAALAWAYRRFGTLPAARALLYGVKPVVIAIVLQALWRLGRTAVKSRLLAAIGLAALAAAAAGAEMLLVLAGAALASAAAGWLTERWRRPPPGGTGPSGRNGGARGEGEAARPEVTPLAPIPGASIGSAVGTVASPGVSIGPAAAVGAAGTAGTAAAAPGLGAIFAVFLKLGAVVFGSGYVLLAFLRADLVVARHWLTEPQLLDAVVVGQVTPGPVFTTATFIGYLLAGPAGALAATAGIFLPAFVLVAATAPMVQRLRRSRLAGALLDGLNVASLALMATVSWQLGRAALVDLPTAAVAIGAATLLLWRRDVNSAWLVLAGAAVGWLLALINP